MADAVFLAMKEAHNASLELSRTRYQWMWLHVPAYVYVFIYSNPKKKKQYHTKFHSDQFPFHPLIGY